MTSTAPEVTAAQADTRTDHRTGRERRIGRARRASLVMLALIGAVGVIVGAAWIARPSTAALCGVGEPALARYAAAPAIEQSVTIRIEGGRPRWVCLTQYADGASSTSWIGR